MVAIGAVSAWLAPIVIAPLFNKFTPLPQSSTARAEVLDLARRAGVDVGNVYRVDASRRVTSLNAYVDGIGSSKRVVLYDNLIHGSDRAELESVVAHELGHVRHDDIVRGLAFVALIAPLGVLFVRLLAEPLLRRAGTDPGSPAALPAYALGLFLASLALGMVGNQLSRKVEASADSFALELTHDPHSFIALQRKLTISTLATRTRRPSLTSCSAPIRRRCERIGAAVDFEGLHPKPPAGRVAPQPAASASRAQSSVSFRPVCEVGARRPAELAVGPAAVDGDALDLAGRAMAPAPARTPPRRRRRVPCRARGRRSRRRCRC